MSFKEIKRLLFVIDYSNFRQFCFLVFLLVLVSLFEVVGISSIMPLISSITDIEGMLENQYFKTLYQYFEFSDNQFRFFIGGVSIALLFTSSFLTLYSNRVMLVYGNNIGKYISVSLYSNYICKDYIFHVSSNSSGLIKDITQEVSRYTQNVFIPILRLISKTIFLIITLILLIYLNPIMALLSVFSVGGIYFIIYILLSKRLSKNGKLISQSNASRFKILSESFAGIKETKLMGLEEKYISNFNRSSQDIATSTASSQSISIIPKSIVELFLFGSLISIILYLVYLNKVNEYLPLLTLFLFMGYRTLPALQMIYSSVVLIKSNESSINSIIDFKVDSEVKNEREEVEFLKEISCEDLSFSYPESEKKVINSLNLKINKNKIIAIAGLSGSGKTTFVDILLGLLKPISGKIQIDGRDVSDRTGLFSYVPQFVHLVDGSIRENITVGSGMIVNEELLHKVIQQSELAKVISELPLGVDTSVGENGAQLSGGQKQRIGLARALYQNKSIIILDEATSALDAIAESKILSSINDLKNEKTIVLITHKLESLKFVDHIVLLEQGSVLAEGNYQELYDLSPKFRELIER